MPRFVKEYANYQINGLKKCLSTDNVEIITDRINSIEHALKCLDKGLITVGETMQIINDTW